MQLPQEYLLHTTHSQLNNNRPEKLYSIAGDNNSIMSILNWTRLFGLSLFGCFKFQQQGRIVSFVVINCSVFIKKSSEHTG